MNLHHYAATLTGFLMKAFVLTGFVMTGCATMTPYKPASKPGGYDGFSQTALETNRFRISFGGNSLTDRETVENYLLYRSAELTVEKGYDYFTLVKQDIEEKTHTRVSSPFYDLYDPYFGYSFFRPHYGWSHPYRYSAYRYSHLDRFHRSRFHHRRFGYGGFGGFNYDPFFNEYDVREITKYRATAEVIFAHGVKPPQKDNAFNARDVLKNLGPTIIYPENAPQKNIETETETKTDTQKASNIHPPTSSKQTKAGEPINYHG